jgi:hypothetical protein
VALKMAGMSVRICGQGSRRKEARKIFFKGKEVRKKT